MNVLHYYLLINDKYQGPYTLEQIHSMWNSGSLTADTLYWTDGLKRWKSIEVLFKISSTPPLPPKQYQNLSDQQESEPPSNTPNKFNRSIFWKLAIIGSCFLYILLAIGSSLLLDQQNVGSINGNENSSQNKNSTPVVSSTPPVEQYEYNPNLKNSFIGWTQYSDGYTWRQAPESEKRNLCNKLSVASPYHGSPDFFYNAINAFYRSGEHLDQPLSKIVSLIDAASSQASPEERQY